MQKQALTDNSKRTVKCTSDAQQTEGQRQRIRKRPFVLYILLDATYSMQPYVDAVYTALSRMLDVLSKEALEAVLGLIIFRDELEGEKPEVYPIGTSPQEVQDILSRVKAIGGGSIPESSLPAIMRAIDTLRDTDPQLPRVFLHITDAPPHDPEAGHTARAVLEALKQNRIIFFCCAPAKDPYRAFANVTGGTLFPIERKMDVKTFEGVLMDFARATAKTLRMAPGEISDSVRNLLDETVEGS